MIDRENTLVKPLDRPYGVIVCLTDKTYHLIGSVVDYAVITDDCDEPMRYEIVDSGGRVSTFAYQNVVFIIAEGDIKQCICRYKSLLKGEGLNNDM